jgi:hypothetical protein
MVDNQGKKYPAGQAGTTKAPQALACGAFAMMQTDLVGKV